MKQVKLIAVFFLCLCLISTGTAESDIDVFTDDYMFQNGFANENGRYYFQSLDMDNCTFYAYLTDQGVYTYQPGSIPERICYLPAVPDNLSLIYNTLTEEERIQLDNSVTFIAAYNNILYGYNIYSGKFGTIDNNGIHWSDVRLDFSCLFNPGYFYPNAVLQNLMTDEELFTFVMEYSDIGETIFSIYGFDLVSGESRKLEVDGLCGVCRAENGTFLCLRWMEGKYQLSKLDLHTGTIENLEVSLENLGESGIIGGLAYSPETQTICLVANNLLYKSVSGGAFSPVNQLTTTYLLPETQAWMLPDGRYAILLDGLHIRGDKEKIDHSLTLSSGIPVDALHFYEAAHPEEPLEFADPLTADDLARYITTQDASIDIFVVKADYNFTQLKRKGYAAPLDASQALTASLAEMDESIAQVLLDENGALVAWPHELSIWEYGINEGYWEMFWPDRPLPKTFGEVLDAWIDWERNLAQDYPGVGFMNWEFDYAYLLETFMNLYVMQHDAEGSVDFDSPELKSVLQKLQEVYEIRLAKGRSTSPDEPDTQLMVQSETGPGYIFYVTTYIAMSDRNPTPNQTPDSYLYGVSKSSITELPLVFEEETVPYTNARMYVFVVNPYSTKIDAAIRFLECMAQVEANSRLYYAIHPGENEPYPRANYEQIRDSYTQQKAEYEEAIQRAKDANEEYDPVLETRVQSYEDWLADEGNRWQIKRETIEEFRQMVREYPLHLHAESPFLCEEGTSTYQLMRDACEKYASGLSSLDGFLAELSTKMRMVEAENL